MLEKSNIHKVFHLLCLFPTERFTLREIARRTCLSPPTVFHIMKTLRKDKLVVTEKAGVALQISASLTEPFRQLKRVHNLEQIYESGLIDYLNELYRHPQAIVLFGSYSRGEDTERSDTDIAILTDKHLQPTMATFEKKIGRPISIHEVDTSRVSEEFKNSLCNGVVLEGAI